MTNASAALFAHVEGVGSGELTAGEAGSLVSLVEASPKAIEVQDLVDNGPALCLLQLDSNYARQGVEHVAAPLQSA